MNYFQGQQLIDSLCRVVDETKTFAIEKGRNFICIEVWVTFETTIITTLNTVQYAIMQFSNAAINVKN